MLQQTQVDRVLPKYKSWIREWPNWRALARATDRQLLTAWSGLGYNRRSLYLGRMARMIVTEFAGLMPRDPETLAQLPGIGPYTSRAILIFAFNQPLVTIDTNIRRVLLHEFDLPPTTSREELETLASRLLPRGRSRDWHNALMDYSALILPKQLRSIPPLVRQTRFRGSLRQIRGEIVRRLTKQKSVTLGSIAKTINRSVVDITAAAKALEKDGIVRLRGTRITLAHAERG